MGYTDKPVSNTNGTKYEEALFADRLLQVVNNHDTSIPLFLHYAPHIVHSPHQVPNDYSEKFSFIGYRPRQVYTAMVKCLDDVVGNLTTALKQHGLWDNLLFITNSDSSGPIFEGANNYPLRGGKYTNFQGGIRVNAFVLGGYLYGYRNLHTKFTHKNLDTKHS